MSFDPAAARSNLAKYTPAWEYSDMLRFSLPRPSPNIEIFNVQLIQVSFTEPFLSVITKANLVFSGATHSM